MIPKELFLDFQDPISLERYALDLRDSNIPIYPYGYTHATVIAQHL